MSLVENEQTKLPAGALNSAAMSSLTVGVLAPIAAGIYNIGTAAIATHTLVVAWVVGWPSRWHCIWARGMCCDGWFHDSQPMAGICHSASRRACSGPGRGRAE